MKVRKPRKKFKNITEKWVSSKITVSRIGEKETVKESKTPIVSFDEIVQKSKKSKGPSSREENDFYSTDPRAVDLLLENEKFSKVIFECSCGNGAISERLILAGHIVISSDLIQRDYGIGGLDFLKYSGGISQDCIINPPFKLKREFIHTAMGMLTKGHKLAVYLDIRTLAGIHSYLLFQQYRPAKILVFSKRLPCYKGGDLNIMKGKSTKADFVWVIFYHDFKASTELFFINNTGEKKILNKK